jgi:hypothetical protein
MKRMKDIREKILNELDQKPGDTFSVSAIARAIGSNNMATNSALGRLFKKGLVARPQKGVYTSKGLPPQTVASPEPVQAQSTVAVKKTEPCAAPRPVSLSVITIDLLVEGAPSKMDCSGLLEKVLGSTGALDARVSKVAEADHSKLKVRFAFAAEK